MEEFIIERLDHDNPSHQNLVSFYLYDMMLRYYENYYPDFKEWYTKKVIPGFIDHTRVIFVVRNINAALIKGVAIIKPSRYLGQRNKISSFLIETDIAGHNIGSNLLRACLQELSSNKFSRQVIMTVPEEKNSLDFNVRGLGTFLTYYGFIELEERLDDRYRIGKTEYVFIFNLDDNKDIYSLSVNTTFLI